MIHTTRVRVSKTFEMLNRVLTNFSEVICCVIDEVFSLWNLMIFHLSFSRVCNLFLFTTTMFFALLIDFYSLGFERMMYVEKCVLKPSVCCCCNSAYIARNCMFIRFVVIFLPRGLFRHHGYQALKNGRK